MVEKTAQTLRLNIRPFKTEDAQNFFELTQDQDIQEFVPYACPETFEDSRLFIEKYYSKGDFVHDFYLVLEDISTLQMIGALIVTEDISGRELEMSLLIAKEFRKKGYMNEALNAFLKFIPSKKVLSFTIRSDNEHSIRTTRNFGAIETESIEPGYRKFIYVCQ